MIATIQMNSTANVQDNLETIARLVDSAKKQGATIALLPENCVFMGKTQEETRTIAEPLGSGTIQQSLSNIAQQQQIWLLVGGCAIRVGDVIYQTLLVYNAQGVLVHHYYKRHLFNVTLPNKAESYRESDVFASGDDCGNNCCIVDTPVGKVGLAICYDLRFPEHFRKLVDLGAEILVLPAAFTYTTGKAHWEPLLRARAIENQCYMVASGQCGKHENGRETWGHSMIINPWGEIITELKHHEGVAVASIDLINLHHQRTTFPVLEHRKG